MNRFKLAFIFALLSTACKSDLKDDLIEEVDHKCRTVRSGCTISMLKATKFKWDKMFVFGAWTLSDSIASKIKLPYYGTDVPDDNVRLLFTYNKKVCYEEDLRPFDNYNTSIAFEDVVDSLVNAEVNYFTPEKAFFNVTKGISKDACDQCWYYIFKPNSK